MKIDLTDLTFQIPIRIDSIVRIENLIMTVEYLLKYFDCKITVLEADAYENGILPKLLDSSIDYRFVEDKDPIFYRTKYLNMMTKTSTTSFVAIWDADVLLDKKQIVESVEKLRLNEIEIVYPYDGNFYDTSMILRELFFKTREIELLVKHKAKMKLIYGNDFFGGAVIVNRLAYEKSGMEDENFYGWSPEDFERYYRWKGLNYKIDRIEGCLFHLSHGRGINSRFRSIPHSKESGNRLRDIKLSSYDEIIRDIEIRGMHRNSGKI